MSILSRADIRVSPTTAPLVHRVNELGGTKTISFTFWTGSLFLYNPGSHMWMIGDGYIAPGNPYTSLQGRGIIVGRSNHCDGVSFEHFGVNNGFPEPCIPIDFEDFEFYQISLEVLPDEMTVQVIGPGISEDATISLWAEYPSFDTVMGVAIDKNPSTYGFFNVIQTIYGVDE